MSNIRNKRYYFSVIRRIITIDFKSYMKLVEFLKIILSKLIQNHLGITVDPVTEVTLQLK